MSNTFQCQDEDIDALSVEACEEGVWFNIHRRGELFAYVRLSLEDAASVGELLPKPQRPADTMPCILALAERTYTCVRLVRSEYGLAFEEKDGADSMGAQRWTRVKAHELRDDILHELISKAMGLE